jgi:hypothetical protein
MKSKLEPKSLKDLADAYRKKSLRVAPDYQRGLTWRRPQQQGLIDSLLRGYEIPVFYVHIEESTNPYTKKTETTAWIVDGQQRLAAITDFLDNKFPMPNPKRAHPGVMMRDDNPPWVDKKFQDLDEADRLRLMERTLHVFELTAEQNEVRELFIRLQAGTPLTAQEKRDAWPGDFPNYVIRHAGKPGHPLGDSPKPFFDLFRAQSKKIIISDTEHYVDKRANIRKFFTQLALTVMRRERENIDFSNIGGTDIDSFYLQNLDLPDNDDGAARVTHLLDTLHALPNSGKLGRDSKQFNFTWGLHLALLVDSLDNGNYATD